MYKSKILIYIYIIFLLFNISCNKKQLPSINIEKDNAIGWKNKEACKIIYISEGKQHEIPAKIKCRGGSSSKYGKHSFSLELDYKFSLGNLPKDDDWIINASYIDKTFMRHKISYDIFKQMSDKNMASLCTYTNLSVNGNYKGLYIIMEEMNASMLGINKDDTLSMLFKDPPIFYEKKLKYVQDSLNYYHQKYPKIYIDNKTYYIERFKRFLFYTNDITFTKEIGNWVDIENVIDWHILLLFSNGGDGIMKNFYLYKIDSQTPFRFGIWDCDHSFGRDGDNELNMGEKELNWRKSILLKRLVEIKETGYSIKLKERWQQLRKLNIVSIENIEWHVNQNDQIIKLGIDENFEKWPINYKWYYDSNNYKEELDLMIKFVTKRITMLDEYINDL